MSPPRRIKTGAQRGESAFSRIIVHDFHVPIKTLDAMTVVRS
jgi:hypothetical protein